MSNVVVNLIQGVDVVNSTTTDASGYYVFEGVCPGSYKLEFSTLKAVGGINSTDAAQVNAWGVGPQYSIEKVRFFAGDVVINNYIQASDAGQILSYFINNGNPPVPITPRWTFWKTNDMTSAQNPSPTPREITFDVPVGSMPIVINAYALVSGDFNQSFNPGAGKSSGGSVNLTCSGKESVETNSVIDLPIVVDQPMEIGAISLILNYPSSMMEILNVSLGNDPAAIVGYSANDDELRIGWYSPVSLNLAAGEKLINLKVRLKEATADGQQLQFFLSSDDLVEIADKEYRAIENVKLAMNTLSVVDATVTGNIGMNTLSFTNYPNPFRNTTTFDYTLPADGRVTLEISNMLGARILKLADEQQSAGRHTWQLDEQSLVPGVYLATLKLTSAGSKYEQTIRIIRK